MSVLPCCGVADACRRQCEGAIYESVDAAAADERRLRGERQHVELARAHRDMLAEILRRADGKRRVIALRVHIGLRRLDRKERVIPAVDVVTEVMLVLRVDVEARTHSGPSDGVRCVTTCGEFGSSAGFT